MAAFPNGWLGLGSDQTQDALAEPTDAGYARAAIAFTPLQPGAPCQSIADAAFGPAATAWPAITCMGLFASQTGGDASASWPLSAPLSIGAGTSYTASAGTVMLRFIDASDLLVRGTVTFQPGNVIALSGQGLPVSTGVTTTFSVVAAWGSAASGSGNLTTEPLTDTERTDVRRFCGYPAYGSGASGEQSWRFFQAYGALEYRLTNLAPAELVRVRAFLAQLGTLEDAVPTAGDNLDTDQAAVWTHNRNEVRDRSNLLLLWSRRLADFLGVPYAPTRAAAGGAIVI